MDLSALTFIHAESSRPMTQPTLVSTPQPPSIIPEAYYDYLPPEHRALESEEAKQDSIPTPLFLKPYSDVRIMYTYY
jgi:hypothetical protein